MLQNQDILQDITVKPCLYLGANAKPMLENYYVKFNLQQTNLLILLNLDDHNNPVRPGQIFLDHYAPPKESEFYEFEPMDEASWEDLRFYLKESLGLDAKNEDAVMDKLLLETTMNDGYNNLESYYVNDKGRRLQKVHLLVTISQLKVIHIPVQAKLGIVPSEYSMLCKLKRPRAEDDELAAFGGGECSSRCSKMAKVEKFDAHGGGECSRVEKIDVYGGDGSGKEECTICLDELDDNKQLASMCCDHVFHEECIVKWLVTNLSCPLCRLGLSRASLSH